MQERVTPQGDDFAEIVVQWNPDHGSVGVGLEPCSSVPSLHFVDALYGDVPTRTEIGRMLLARLRQDVPSLVNPVDFRTSDEEAEYLASLGRMALDAVTGSSPLDGLWTWLDRPGANRLVRLLRKARDASFGRDE